MSYPNHPPFVFAAQHNLALSSVGGLPIAVIGRQASAQLVVKIASRRHPTAWVPPVMTSANGQVVSFCARGAAHSALFLGADLIHADGMPLVFASRWNGQPHLPERVATTDLFHDVAMLAESSGTTFYLLGATATEVEAAARRVREAYPRLQLVGARSGYFAAADEDIIVSEINALSPDVLWIGMGVPHEQHFALRNRAKLNRVGVIKTAGGLFDFLSAKNSRAPKWMQASGLEWMYRLALEPRRLGVRYLKTNPHALWLLMRDSPLPAARRDLRLREP